LVFYTFILDNTYCAKFELFESGSLTVSATGPKNCDDNTTFESTFYTKFESTSGNTATYAAEGALSYVGTISTFVQLGAIEMDIVP
jgi:hypothetical protein